MFTKAVQVGVLWKDGTDLQVLVRKLHCRAERERGREGGRERERERGRERERD